MKVIGVGKFNNLTSIYNRFIRVKNDDTGLLLTLMQEKKKKKMLPDRESNPGRRSENPES